ncbi:MAG: heme exporter protein CcmB [Ignavibacteria bacterium]
MLRQALAICMKDFRSEIRTRYSINGLIMFIIVTISIIKFSLGEEKLSNELQAGLLWIIIFFSNSSGLSRVFVAEEDRGTSFVLKLTANSRAVLLGKLIFNSALSFIINFVVVFLFLVTMDMTVNSTGLFIAVVIIGNFGLTAVMTIIAALISKSNSKGTLYPVLSFPLLLPLLLTVINATWMSFEGTSFGEVSAEFQILVSYTIVVLTASFLLFDLVWND